ncbi:magnesium transporter MgtE N-terminal domain-containing protein [Paenibacillus tepidiphilus]|uniref:MotE family protein n=1 Tax=Paenibacillus tepidiphilus TaxID=2608683 RepID=UPI001238CB49|nr:kinesin [Paenibacillus tepidiphilus]
MANNELEIENEESASKFERFLFLMIPIIFTLVLLGVLLTLFNMDVREKALKIADKILFVERFVPDPVADTPAESAAEENDQTDSEKQLESSESTIKELKAQLASQAAQLQQANEAKSAQDSRVEALQKQIDDMKAEAEAAEAVAAEEAVDPYQDRVTELAKLYSGMKASKAAPILENLTTEEQVQIFSAMNNASKTAILEKMDPEAAAEVTVRLKETASSADMAVAALQSRLKQEQAAKTAATTGTSANLDKEQLAQTFGAMPAADAATLLSSMYSISPDKVITILNTVDDSIRSSILSEMASADDEGALAAKIVNRLMGGK